MRERERERKRAHLGMRNIGKVDSLAAAAT
jgi:hypothetical protein